jgi:hypothetical protein
LQERRTSGTRIAIGLISGQDSFAVTGKSAYNAFDVHIEPRIMKRITRGLLTVATILALAALSTHAVSHWHVQTSDEDHCQVCHVGHAAIPQPAAQVAAQAPTQVAHVTLDNESAPHLDFVGTPSIPRAPPA